MYAQYFYRSRCAFRTLSRPSAKAFYRGLLANAFRCAISSSAYQTRVRDPSTLSNYDAWHTRHTSLDLRIDFKKRILGGAVTLDLESLTHRESSEVVLDARFLDISSVAVDSITAKWKLGQEHSALGSPLRVAMPGGVAKGQIVKLHVKLQTTDRCTALLWLGSDQTPNEENDAFVFSQCYSIHARTLFPCQDTPDVKSTFTMNIASPMTVIASGLSSSSTQKENIKGEYVYSFEQKIPIPTYLFALASGDLVSAPIGPNSSVVASPSQIDVCQREFQGGMSNILQEAESLLTPYLWGESNVLVMPVSFPYGGMEHPVYTFASPIVITGDGQGLRDGMAHELSHGWSGNLVTNCSWEHYWLNEGWTVYLERRIASRLHGDAYFHLSCLLGWKRLEEDVERLGADHEFTKLCINLEGIHPDEAFCSVPYEKGFCLMYFLERLVTRDNFDKFMRHYFKVWAKKSLDSNEFRETFVDFFSTPEYVHLADKIAAIDWDELLYAPGLPSKPNYDTSLVEECEQLANKWKNQAFIPTGNDIEGWTSNQQLAFLNFIHDFAQPLSVAQSQALGRVYGLSSTDNVPLRTAFYQISLRAEDFSTYQGAVELLGRIGTIRYVRQLSKALAKVDKDLAMRTFEENKSFYHPACISLVEKELSTIG